MNEARPLRKVFIALTLIAAGGMKLSLVHLKSLEDLTHFSSVQLGPWAPLLLPAVIFVVFLIWVAWVGDLWNNVVPRITGWREITFWEAVGVTALAVLLL